MYLILKKTWIQLIKSHTNVSKNKLLFKPMTLSDDQKSEGKK